MSEERTTPTIDLTVDWATQKGSYTADAECWNCGRRYVLKISKGYKIPRGGISTTRPASCPHCGCDEVVGVSR